MPANVGYRTSDSSPCRAWPNSWKSVTTSATVSSVGPAAGLVRFRVLSTTGRVPSSRDCTTKLFIHAPPRLVSRA